MVKISLTGKQMNLLPNMVMAQFMGWTCVHGVTFNPSVNGEQQQIWDQLWQPVAFCQTQMSCSAESTEAGALPGAG
jgi:hypothetical protein